MLYLIRKEIEETFMFFGSCKSCNRPPLPDILVTIALLFVGVIAVLLAFFTFKTIFFD
jgi:hypothetical protein